MSAPAGTFTRSTNDQGVGGDPSRTRLEKMGTDPLWATSCLNMAPANVKCFGASRRTSVDERLFVMARSLARAPEACNGVTMEVARYDYAAQFGDDIGALVTDIGRMLVGGRYILTEEVREFENA